MTRICASDLFVQSARLQRFLRYIAERTSAGDGDRLKEFVIGTEVFDRGDQYDPRLDSVVRVEAGRLRSKLEAYYAGPGATDPLVIRLPRGGYVPTFEWPSPPSSAAATSGAPLGSTAADAVVAAPWWRRSVVRPAVATLIVLVAVVGWTLWPPGPRRAVQDLRVAVLPFESYSTDTHVTRMAGRVTDELTMELARLGTFQVASHVSARDAAGRGGALRNVAGALHADLVLLGAITPTGDRWRIQAALVDVAADRKFWVTDETAPVSDLPAAERRLAQAAAAEIVSNTRGSYWISGRGRTPEPR